MVVEDYGVRTKGKVLKIEKVSTIDDVENTLIYFLMILLLLLDDFLIGNTILMKGWWKI